MSQGTNDDGSIADLPWAAVFDPASNARVMGSVQARGFRAATEVVNRFVKIADGRSGADASDAQPKSEGTATQRADADQVILGWQQMFGRLAQALSANATAGPSTASGEPTVDLGNASASGQLVFDADGPGAVSTEVWLHNGGSVDMGKVRLRCSDLLAHDGATVPAACVRFEPDVVPMFARSSRGVTMALDLPDDVRPGRYRGTLLADGHEDVWLPVLLVVVASTA